MCTVCLPFLFSPESLLAQQQGNRPVAATAAELSSAARLRLSTPSQAHSAPVGSQVALARPSRKTGETLMIVGGAVLLAGLLADEAIISIAGVAIGGYGLFVYLDADKRR
jgi:hypothetical protein